MLVAGAVRRLGVAVVIALGLVLGGSAVYAQMIPTPEICKTTGPSDWEWWAHFCWNYPTASARARAGFLVVR